jgi:hypothetical protein
MAHKNELFQPMPSIHLGNCSLQKQEMCFSTNNQTLGVAPHVSYTGDIESYFLDYKVAEA